MKLKMEGKFVEVCPACHAADPYSSGPRNLPACRDSWHTLEYWFHEAQKREKEFTRYIASMKLLEDRLELVQAVLNGRIRDELMRSKRNA